MREGSFSSLGLELILNKIKEYEADVELLSLRQTNLPMFYSTNGESEVISKVTKMVKSADAFILATPDYHGSMSGPMKNFLDYYWSEFAGKLFGYVCASHEKGLTAMDQIRTAIRQCYGWSMPYGVSINGEEDFDKNKNITNMSLNSRLEMLSRDIVVYGKLLRIQFVQDLSNNDTTFASRYRE